MPINTGTSTNTVAAHPPASAQTRAIAAFQSEDFDQAVALFSDLLTAEPENPLPHAYLAFICARQGLIEEARAFISEAARLAPAQADSFNAALGETFLKAGNPLLSEEFLFAAIQGKPDLFAAYPALAKAMRQNGRMTEAIQLLQGAATIPSATQKTLQDLLLEWLSQQGDIEALVEFCGKHQPALQMLRLSLLPRTGYAPERIRSAVRDIVSAAAMNYLPVSTDDRRLIVAPAPHKPLAIAFLVSDFRREQLSLRLEALLLHLPPERYITAMLYNDPESGAHELAQRCSLINDHCIVSFPKSDAEILQSVDELGIQVLVDMDGLSARNRFSLFAAARVPCKLSWDDTALLRESGFTCIQGEALSDDHPLTFALPGMGELHNFADFAITPRPADEPPRFGCLCAAVHYNRDNWRLFAKLLAQTPASRLVINLAELGEMAQAFISEIFAKAQVAPERLEFIRAIDLESLATAWNRVDVGLAPLEGPGDMALPLGLWMEKPYLALAGDAPWSRRPAAWLATLGLDDFIARTPDDLLTRAAHLFHAPNALRRTDLRQKMRALPGASAQNFALDFATRLEKTLSL